MIQPNRRKPCVRRGFTLIEMLTVIGIIAVLAAILFPVFAKAREKGRQATCVSNLKQIGVAIEAYGADSGGFLPLANNKQSIQGAPGIADVLQSYAKSRQIFRCPSDKDEMWKPVLEGGEGTSYDYALGLLNIGMPVTRIDTPWGAESSKTPILSDFSEKWHTAGVNILYADGHVKNAKS